MVNATAASGKIEELESLRGVAALLVVFFHLRGWHPWLDIGPVHNGYLMVELFFVLSGFVIYNAYGSRITTREELVRFQFLRFARLYPVHLLFLLAFLGIECLKLLMPAGVALNTAAFSVNNPTAFVEQLLLVQALGPTGHEMSFNAPAWSISTEFYTYLLFALIVLLTGRLKLPIFAAIALCSFAVLTVTGGLGFKLILNCLTGFFIGCLLCEALSRRQFTLPAALLPVTILSFLAYLAIKQPESQDWLIFLFSPLLILALLRGRETALTRAMRSPLLTRLGALSYAVYMSHVFVISMISMIMKRVFGVGEAVDVTGAMSPDLPPVAAALAVLFALAATLAVSHVVHFYLEVPLRERSREVVGRKLHPAERASLIGAP